MIFDKLINLVSGLGTGKDKTMATQYALTVLDDGQASTAYRSDWLAKKAVLIPAQDSTREWRTWVGDSAIVDKVIKLEEKLGVQSKVFTALLHSRLFGGSAIYFGIKGAADLMKPLDVTKLREGDLEYLYLVRKSELSAGPLVTDLRSEWFGQPSYYNFQPSGAPSQAIHPSRFAILKPHDQVKLTDDHSIWGDSMLQSVYPALQDATVSCHVTGIMLQESTIDVFKIPDLLNNVSDKDYRSRLIERFQLATVAKSTINATLMDSNEEWERKETSFAGIADCVRLMLSVAAGAVDIPITRLLGESPGGLNATGESDLRNYYDSVRSWQNNVLRPALSTLDRLLVASVGGGDDVYYEWNSLWQQSATEKADVLVKKVTAVQAVFNTGLIPDAVLSPALEALLVDDGQIPGIEAARADFDAAGLDEDDPAVREQFETPKGEQETSGGADK